MGERHDSELLRAVELVCSASSDPIALLDVSGDVAWVNPAMSQTYGYDPSELEGRPLCITLASHDPVTGEDIPFTSESMGGGVIESVTRRADGSPLWIECERRVVHGEAGVFMLTLRDITWSRATVGVHAARSAILTASTGGEPLEVVLDELLNVIHEHTVGLSPSIMLRDPETNTLRCASARGLPRAYTEGLVAIPIAPKTGACGTAAFTATRQISHDILDHDDWRDYQVLAGLSGMRACWSEPIIGAQEEVLGTFALYYETPRTPTEQEQAFFEDAANLVREAIERGRHDRALANEREARARSERRLQQLHDLAPDAIITTDEQRRIISFNNAAIGMFGWAREEIMGQPIEVLVPPEHQDAHANASREFTCNNQSPHIAPRMVTAQHRDGSIFSGEASLYYYVEGTERFATAIIRDISERLHLERAHMRESALRKVIVDHVPSMIYWKDHSRTVQGCNLALARATGFERSEDVIGLESLHPKGWTILRQTDPVDEEKLLSGEVADHIQELVLMHEGGAEHTVTLRTVCMKGTDDEVIGLLGICDDVTESKRTAKIVLQQQKMEALGRLVGGVAHDFNNLLFVIQSNLELIEDELPTDDLIDACMRDAIDATARGARLTRQLLSTGRRANLSPSVVDLNETLVRVENMLRRTIPESIDIQLEQSALPCFTRIDVSLFENALLNLAINARDAMKTRGVLTIGVDEVIILEHEADLMLDAGRYARVYVTDTGEGMSPEVIEHAFEPFFTTKSIDEGTGMGLAMVHGFVVQSRGATRITSEEGAGTTITLFLPSHAEGLDEISEPPPLDDSNERLHVMLVEDDDKVRRALESVLESMGHEVTAVEHAHTALDTLAATTPSPHVILSDAVMPGQIQGPEFSKRVEDLYPDIPVVLMSGYPVLPTSHEDLPDTPIQLSKPFSRAELIAALDQAVHTTDTLQD